MQGRDPEVPLEALTEATGLTLPGPFILEEAVDEDHKVLATTRKLRDVAPCLAQRHADRQGLVGAGQMVAPQAVEQRQDRPAGLRIMHCGLARRDLTQGGGDPPMRGTHPPVHACGMGSLQSHDVGGTRRERGLDPSPDRVVHVGDDVDDGSQTVTG